MPKYLLTLSFTLLHILTAHFFFEPAYRCTGGYRMPFGAPILVFIYASRIRHGMAYSSHSFRRLFTRSIDFFVRFAVKSFCI